MSPAARPPSPRELEVFAAYCRTGTTRRTAAALDVSEQTIKNHLGRLYAALEVPGNMAAATALGWLVVPESIVVVAPLLVEADVIERLTEIRKSIDAAIRAHEAA